MRPGFSLLEVLVATAILLGSAVVLFHMAGVGTRHAVCAEDLAEAQWICQTKLNEILSGLRPLERVQETPLADKPGWVYSVEIEPLEDPAMPVELAMLRVRVAEDVEEDHRGLSFTLSRWVPDPHLEDQATQEPEAGTDDRPGLLEDEDALGENTAE